MCQHVRAFNELEDRNMKTIGFNRYVAAVGALTALGTLMPATALADGPQATSTAATHAGMAASNGDLAVVKNHLQHVLNCLVGPTGEGFDAKPGNPCAAAGGAIPQTADAAQKAKLEKAATQVRAALKNPDVAAAKKAATEVQTLLK